jgi:hypothetical protein
MFIVIAAITCGPARATFETSVDQRRDALSLAEMTTEVKVAEAIEAYQPWINPPIRPSSGVSDTNLELGREKESQDKYDGARELIGIFSESWTTGRRTAPQSMQKLPTALAAITQMMLVKAPTDIWNFLKTSVLAIWNDFLKASVLWIWHKVIVACFKWFQHVLTLIAVEGEIILFKLVHDLAFYVWIHVEWCNGWCALMWLFGIGILIGLFLTVFFWAVGIIFFVMWIVVMAVIFVIAIVVMAILFIIAIPVIGCLGVIAFAAIIVLGLIAFAALVITIILLTVFEVLFVILAGFISVSVCGAVFVFILVCGERINMSLMKQTNSSSNGASDSTAYWAEAIKQLVFGLLKAVFEVPARELIDLIIIYSNASIIWNLSIPRVRGFQIVDMPWLDNICADLRDVANQIVHGLDLDFQCGGSGVYLITMWWVGVTILIQIIISSGFMISLWTWIHKAQHDIEQHTTFGLQEIVHQFRSADSVLGTSCCQPGHYWLPATHDSFRGKHYSSAFS